MTSEQLRQELKSKRERERLSLRQVEKAIGTGASYATLWRVEHGGAFDYDTGLVILRWLRPEGERRGTLAAISDAVFADAKLTDKQKAWLVEAFTEAYGMMTENKETKK